MFFEKISNRLLMFTIFTLSIIFDIFVLFLLFSIIYMTIRERRHSSHYTNAVKCFVQSMIVMSLLLLNIYIFGFVLVIPMAIIYGFYLSDKEEIYED